jgi:hypothetical protein
MMAATVADLAQVERDLESTAGSLQRYFRVPDGEDENRFLYLAIESLMRAVSGQRLVIEQQQKHLSALRDRMNREAYDRS